MIKAVKGLPPAYTMAMCTPSAVASGQWLNGSITDMMTGNGFIKVTGKDAEYFNGDIYFPKHVLRSGGLDVVRGDEVTFMVRENKGHHHKWRAFNVKVIKFKPNHQKIDYVLKMIQDEDDNSGVLQEMMNVNAIWEMIGNYEKMDKTLLLNIVLSILMLEKKSRALSHSFKSVLAIITSSNLCNSQSGHLRHWIDRHWRSRDSHMEEAIKAFFLIVVEYLPHKARMITTLCKLMLPQENVPMVQFLYDMLYKVTFKNASEISDLDWNELPLVPSNQELLIGPMEPQCHLSPVKPTGSYQSPQEYMDTYFRLLRADCFNDLSSGICAFLENKLDPRDMNIYKEVRLVAVNIMEYGNKACLAMQVKPLNKIKDWETCSNLMFGNLLCFSPSGQFNDTIWAMVKQRDPQLLKSDQVIWVELCTESNSSDDIACLSRLHEASGKTILAESPTYYTAYQPVLRALQKMDPRRLPFQEELVYLSGPKPSFAQALTQRLSVIQGPPGTGKTYIGIEIIRRILTTLDQQSFPILVLTYKNHALDEFLKAIWKFLPTAVARVGGRSRDRDLEDRNINHLKQNVQLPTTMHKQRQEILSKASSMKKYLEMALGDLEKRRQLSSKTLLYGFSGSQIESLLLGSLDFCQPLEASGNIIDFTAVWEAQKRIIYDEEMMTDQKYLQLDLNLIKWMKCAIQVWMPANETFSHILTNEERLSCFLSAQSQQNNPRQNIEELGGEDETDIEDEQRERLSAISQVQKPLEMTVKFNALGDSFYPQMIPCAKRLAGEIPLTIVKGIKDVWELSFLDRAVIIQVLLWHHQRELEQDIKVHYEQYKDLQNSLVELQNQHKVSILKSMKVVGMTITGACIHQQLLQALKPAIVLVEEAAEVLEPQLIAVLGDWVKHLLLIGDHKQLKPKVETYDLVKNYNFDLSMMERLIKNDYPYTSLNTQNRMRAEIAALLQDIYPDLQSNLKCVQLNAAPEFIPFTIYFWTHDYLDGIDGYVGTSHILQETAQIAMQGRSLVNIPEAERAIKLALLFIQQGYKPSEITILAAYNGQVKLLRRLYSKAESDYSLLFQEFVSSESTRETGKGVKIHTIDMYQGDENKIVIVSLVRSNPTGNIGFLKSLNRRCVAQSRAKCGLYFIGSLQTLTLRNSPWSVLIEKMIEDQLVGNKLPIICSRHPHVKIMATDAWDIPLGGLCKETCNQLMDCKRHLCKKTCQPFHTHNASECEVEVGFNHSICMHPDKRKCCISEKKIVCKKPCQKLMACDLHPCTNHCQPEHSHSAELCMIEVDFNFSKCGHKWKKKCGEDETHILCEAKVPFMIKKCRHMANRKCYQDESKISCKEPCPRRLPCRHPCSGLCGDLCDPSKCEPCEEIEKVKMKRMRELEKERKKKAIQEAKQKLEDLKKKKELLRFELLPTGDTASEYIDVEDRVIKYIQPSHHWNPMVTRIEKVFNPRLEAAWLAAKIEMTDPTRSELKFHGTAEANIEMIMKEGFKLSSPKGKPSMFGRGIYFATDSSKSAQEIYTKGSNKLLLCDVLIGRSLTVDHAVPNMSAEILEHERYDSLYAKRGTHSTGGVLNDEYVMYNPAQALPNYIVSYNQLGHNKMNLTPTLPLGAKSEHHVLYPKRQFDADDPLDVHFRIAESQFLRLGSTHKVSRVDFFIIPKLCQHFLHKKTEFEKKFGVCKKSKPILAFHGTRTDQNIDNIMRENFNLGMCHAFAFGRGVYFSEFPDVSKGYAAGTKKLILCKILPGESYEASQAMANKPIQKGYNSHIVRPDPEGKGQMVVIDDIAQILPTYVITYG